MSARIRGFCGVNGEKKLPFCASPRFTSPSSIQATPVRNISEEVGSAKPEGEIFDAAFAKMNHPEKRRVLMVGDSLTSDIKGGNDYGIDTCWFNPHRQAPQDGIEPVYEVHRLDQIVEVVNRGR